MRLKLMWVMLLGAAIVAITAQYTKPVLATSAAGFVGTTLARGRFGDINVFSHLVPPDASRESGSDVWLSLQKTKGLSDVYVQSNVWAPAGSTGWHTHPGHSLIIVTAGTVTTYEGDDPECSPDVYTWEWDSSIPAVTTCTTSGMKAPRRRERSPCRRFQPMPCVGSTPRIQGTAPSDRRALCLSTEL